MTYYVIKQAKIENVKQIKDSEFYHVFTSEGTFKTKHYQYEAMDAMGNTVDFCVYSNDTDSYFSSIVHVH